MSKTVTIATVLALLGSACTHTHRLAPGDRPRATTVDRSVGVREGAGIGVLTGAALGAVIGYGNLGHDECNVPSMCSPGDLALFYGVGLGLTGLLIGGTIGAVRGSHDVYVPSTDARPAVLVGPGRVAAAWSF